MKNAQDGMGIKNMSELILKEIYVIHETKNQFKKYKMTERQIFEKHANLNEEELNTKSNKNVYIKCY